ncbi:MAG: hypothetical protein CMI54_04695 [Parcubacteria group bacterium]|nr:hypothetical protein [Parcubacteria group bacterium]|tara:strand:+ start:1997 stop:2203 length:207 start_codon:yes stop_codon:yes gene_type:complete
MKYKVTDHALVRYLERVQGIDIKSLKRQISSHIEKRMPDPPKGKFELNASYGIKWVVDDRVVITAIDK